MPRKYKLLDSNLHHSVLTRLTLSDSVAESGLKGCNNEFIVITEKQEGLLDQFVLVEKGQLSKDDIVLVDIVSKKISILYRRDSNSNALFVTDLCNSHCLMCPQPPKDNEGVNFKQLLEIVSFFPKDMKEICITGGEPTLLGNNLIYLIKNILSINNELHIHILTNARRFANKGFVRDFAQFSRERISFGIPLYSNNPEVHDYIVQSSGAFHQSLNGILNLSKYGFEVEIRTVLNRHTIKELKNLSYFIYRSLPFVSHIAIMGMEEFGYVKKNKELLHINLWEHKEEVYNSVHFLFSRGMNCSLYNIPLCHLDSRLHKFSRESISDFKVSFNSVCEKCQLRTKCGGLFRFQAGRTQVFPFINETS